MRLVHVLLGSMLAVMGLGTLVACGDDSDGPANARQPEAAVPPADVLDRTFGSNGFFTWGGTQDQPEEGVAVVRQADGKLVIATRNARAKDYVDVIRLTATGVVDTTFGGDGTGHAIIAGVSSTGSVDLAVGSDGKIFVLGITTALFGNPDSDGAQVLGKEGVLARLDSNGVLDATWGAAGIVRFPTLGTWWATWHLAAQSDGKILVLSHEGAQAKVMRFASDGALDSTFGTAGAASVPGFRADDGAIAVDSAGNILIGGSEDRIVVSAPSKIWSATLTRLRANGSVDESFGDGGSVELAYPHGRITALAVDPSDRVIAAGSRSDGRGGFVLRLGAGGAPDPSFATGYSVFTPEVVRHVEADASHRIVAWSTKHLHRFDPNGAFDTTFGTGGTVDVESPVTLSGVLQPDGLLVSVGTQVDTTANVARLAVTRRNVDGALDPAFGAGGLTITNYTRPADDVALSLEPTPDGKTIVYAASAPGKTQLLRVTADGKLDTSFGDNGVLSVPSPLSAVDGAGRALVITHQLVRRFDAHGAPDSTFGNAMTPGEISLSRLGASTIVRAAGIHPDGRIVLAGTRDSELFLSRTDANGAADPAFGKDGTVTFPLGRAGSVVSVGRVTALADGGVVVAAIVDDRPAVVRVGPDGKPAIHVTANGAAAVFGNGLAIGASAASIPRVAFAQPDGSVVVLAMFSNGYDGYVIERFDADGQLDRGFGVDGSVMNLQTGPNAGYLDGAGPDLAVDVDGRMYVATVMAPEAEDQMVVLRYTADGLPDETWGPRGQRVLTTTPGANAGRCIRMRNDGSLMVGGRMFVPGTQPHGTADVAVARILP